MSAYRLIGLVTLFLGILPLQATTLDWSLNTDRETSGYSVYMGIVSGGETFAANVGNRASYQIAPGSYGTGQGTFFAFVKAYNSSNATGPQSDEVSWTVAAPSTETPAATPATVLQTPTPLALSHPPPTPTPVEPTETPEPSAVPTPISTPAHNHVHHRGDVLRFYRWINHWRYHE